MCLRCSRDLLNVVHHSEPGCVSAVFKGQQFQLLDYFNRNTVAPPSRWAGCRAY